MFVVVYIEYGFACKHAWNIMRKSKVLQLGLQLGFWIATNTCNSQYLYSCEFYQTSCNKHVYNPYIQLRCNLVHFNCNRLSTLVSCTNSCRQKSLWHFIHPLMDEVCSYLLNLFTTVFQVAFDQKNWIFFHSSIDEWMNGWNIYVYCNCLTIQAM